MIRKATKADIESVAALYEKAIDYDSNCITFWKKQNYEDNKKINSCQGLEDEEG